MRGVPEMLQRFTDGSKCLADSPEMCWECPEDALETLPDAFETHQRHAGDAMHPTCTRDAAEMHLKCISRGIRDALLREMHWISI